MMIVREKLREPVAALLRFQMGNCEGLSACCADLEQTASPARREQDDAIPIP